MQVKAKEVNNIKVYSERLRKEVHLKTKDVFDDTYKAEIKLLQIIVAV